MDDIALVDEVVTNQRHKDVPNPKDIRIGIPNEYFFEDLDQEVQSHTEKCIKKLESAGCTLVKD